jgi:hypothetical protein
MLGQLERGYMIATPAFGYLLDRKMDEQGNRIGTRWKISPSAAEVVRNIFTKRAEGQSMHQIARWLNEAGVELAREKQKIDGGFWRASRVKALLCNTIYRGVFTWNGSARIRADALKNGRVLDIKVFPRPDLRLVSDDIWYRCNDKTGRRSAYGGGKHALAGLIRCGCCDSKLVLSSQSRCRSVYCANCTAAKAVAGKNAGMTSTVSAAGVQVLLSKALQHLLTPTFVDHFRDCLRDKLTGDNAREVKALSTQISKLQHAQERLSHLIAKSGDDDPVLTARYVETKAECQRVNQKLSALKQSETKVDRLAIEAQLNVDPRAMLDKMFDAAVPPEKLRSVLMRLFPEIVLEGKPRKYQSHFSVRFCFGSALAMASTTAVMNDGTLLQRYCLTYRPSRKGVLRENLWSVTLLPALLPEMQVAAVLAEAVTKEVSGHAVKIAANDVPQVIAA